MSITPVEKMFSRTAYKDGMSIWGHLYLDNTGETGGGWLTNTWSALGTPYWTCQFHWYDKISGKVFKADLSRGVIPINMITPQYEDKDIDPLRRKFIRDNIQTWEKEWLEIQSNL